MAKIFLIDDDLAAGIIEENLYSRGHEVIRYTSASEALINIDHISQADLVVLDIIMERPPDVGTAVVTGSQTTGMVIYRELRAKNANLPILVLSATNDSIVVDTILKDKNSKFLSKWNADGLVEIVNTIEKLAGVAKGRPEPIVFIVHGHDDYSKQELKNYLQNTLKLPEPIVLHEQADFGRTIIEKFEDYAARTTIAMVLLTPDDKVANAGEDNKALYRARQNVIFEMGYFLAHFGRKSGRVVLLHKGPLDLPSDISGLIYIDISQGIEAAGERIRKELQNVLQ